MTTRLEYLKRCLKSDTTIGKKSWHVMAFAIPILKTTPIEDLSRWSPLDLVVQQDGLYYMEISETGELVPSRIVDQVLGKPLFEYQETLNVDNTWLPSISSTIETKVGRLIVNKIALVDVIGSTIPYINNKFKDNTIENLLSKIVTEEEIIPPGKVSVSQMIECMDRLNFFTGLSTFINTAATAKTITPPPNIEKDKARLIAEYGDRLQDPIVDVEFEGKLMAIDAEYLKDDPAANNIYNKKSRTGRKKIFLSFGDTQDFKRNQDGTVVVPSLSEGVSTDPNDFVNYMNDLRFGSFARGSSTALSGYGYKILQRSLAGLSISNTPCNTKVGLTRTVTDSDYKKLTNRYIKLKDWTLVSNDAIAKSYVGKEVEIRSTMYCTSPGNTVCYACMSEVYKNRDNGINNIAADISWVLMTQFLKLMHGVIMETTTIEMKDLCV